MTLMYLKGSNLGNVDQVKTAEAESSRPSGIAEPAIDQNYTRQGMAWIFLHRSWTNS
jgi:hypothetical protein